MPTAPRTPRIIPVLDVMGGVVVRAVGGRRDQYRPVVSELTRSTDPLAVLDALLATAEVREAYVADLDAIAGAGLPSPRVRDLLLLGGRPCWVDPGIRTVETLLALPPGAQPVIGSETCPGPAVLAELARHRGGNRSYRMAFSLDLRDGAVVGDWRAWGLEHERDAIGLARRVIEQGIGTLIVLDLAKVGAGSGCGTEDILRALRGEFPRDDWPAVELIAGGGVRGWDDVDRLGEAGADAVLVASALHDGRLTFPRPG